MPGTWAKHFTDISHLTFERSYELSFIISVLQMQQRRLSRLKNFPEVTASKRQYRYGNRSVRSLNCPELYAPPLDGVGKNEGWETGLRYSPTFNSSQPV